MKKQTTLLHLTFSDPAQISLEVTLLEPVSPPASPLSGMAVTVSASGHVTLNQRLLEAVMGKSPSLRITFSAYKDRTCILLCPSESGAYKFPKSGRIKDVAFSRSLVEAGISLPARYTVAWNPAYNGWVGVLDTPVRSDAGQARADSLGTQKKRDGRCGA